MTDKLIIYTDGGARGNPGPAALGVVIFDARGREIKKFGKYIGTATNNQAEYRALIVGLEFSQELGADSVVCHMDSELVVKQLQGLYKVREAKLQTLAQDAIRIFSKFKLVQFVHIPREKNKLADQLVNETLNNAGF